MRLVSHTRIWGRASLMVVALGLVVLALQRQRREPPLPPSLVWLSTNQIPTPPLTLFERTVPISWGWGWLWRLHDAITPRRPDVLVDAKFIEWTKANFRLADVPSTSIAAAETNGFHGWILTWAGLESFQNRVEQSQSPGMLISGMRIQTSAGITAKASQTTVGPAVVGGSYGTDLEVLPMVRTDGAELHTVLRVTGLTQDSASAAPVLTTNFEAAARWQLPDRAGLLMLGPPATNGTRQTAVLLSVTIKRRAR